MYAISPTTVQVSEHFPLSKTLSPVHEVQSASVVPEQEKHES